MKKYYGEDKVISRYRLGTAIDELNELLTKSKKMLEDVEEHKVTMGDVNYLAWQIGEKQKEYDLI